MIQLFLVTKIVYYFCLIITCAVYLFRQDPGTQNAKEMQLLREYAANLQKKVTEYEHENRELRRELDTLVCAYA